MSLEFRALLKSSMKALESDPSGENTKRVMLSVLTQTLQLTTRKADHTDQEIQAAVIDVMEQSAQFVETHISIPQFNTPDSGVRALVFGVYHRLAKVLGRNTAEAVKVDIRTMLVAAGERIKYTNSPGRKPKTSAKPQDKTEPQGPELHIEQVIQPLLDDDMKPYIYEMGNYYIEPLRNFYSVLSKWRSEKRLVKVWTDK